MSSVSCWVRSAWSLYELVAHERATVVETSFVSYMLGAWMPCVQRVCTAFAANRSLLSPAVL